MNIEKLKKIVANMNNEEFQNDARGLLSEAFQIYKDPNTIVEFDKGVTYLYGVAPGSEMSDMIFSTFCLGIVIGHMATREDK